MLFLNMDKISVVLRLCTNSVMTFITTNRDLRSTAWKKMGWVADKKNSSISVQMQFTYSI